jgi:lysophospholipase L1-like esterase
MCWIAATLLSNASPPTPAPARGFHATTPTTIASLVEEPSINLAQFAAGVVRGRANLTILGDSIHHPGQPTTMFVGHLLEWRPVRWRQFRPPVNSSFSVNGVWLETSGSADYTYVRPGQIASDQTAIVGTTPFPVQVISREGWSGRAMSSGVHRSVFSEGWGLFRNADSQQTFCATPGTYRHRLLAVTSDEPGCRTIWNVASRNSAGGTDWTLLESSIVLPTTGEPALHWFDQEIPGTHVGEGHQGSALILPASSPLIGGESLALGGTIVTSLDEGVGLGIDYVGEGGWRTEHHLLSPGDPGLPLISSSDGPYAGSYTDEALSRHFAAHETTHVMIYLGANNGGADAENPDVVAADIRAIIQRCRAAHLNRIDQPETPLSFLVVAPYPTNSTSFYPGVAGELRSLAKEDVAFIDLHSMVLDRFGGYENWSSALLRDGVHPSLDGARYFSSMLWRELVAATGPSADLDRSGRVDGADYGLLLLDWGRSGHPGPADLNGDGRIGGADLGVMLEQWFDTAP